MTPDDVRTALAAPPGAAAAAPVNAILASISSTYFMLRRGMALAIRGGRIGR